MPKATDRARNALIARAWNEGRSTAEIAGQHGISVSRVNQILRPVTNKEDRRQRRNEAASSFYRNQDARQRFEARIECDPNSGCWLWSGGALASGYGCFTAHGRNYRAHRFSFAAYVREPGPDEFICHRCDTPACVNPQHLFAGSPADNVADMMAKGRRVQGRTHRGSESNLSKLSEPQVAEIRRAVAAGATKNAMARRYGVSRGAIVQIAQGKTWAHMSEGGRS